MINKIINKVPSIKRFCRLMECTKNNNSYKLSFLVSSKRNFNVILSKKQLKIFEFINGKNSIDAISKKTNSSIKDVLVLIDIFQEKNLITYKKHDVNYIYDRHDLFFDMVFNKENFTKKNICNKKVLIIGAGGIGNNIILLISRIGIKNLVILDNDIVETSNLTRQFLFDKNDIGKPKINVIYEKIKKTNSDINITLINKKFDKNIFNDIYKENQIKKINFAFVSADTPPSIALDAYYILTDLSIPYITVGYLNDYAIFGPIIDKKNEEYEKFIKPLNSVERNNNHIINQNTNYQSPSFGPINMFSASNAVSDMVRYFNEKSLALSLNKKIIFDYNSLHKTEISFENNKKIKLSVFSASSDLGSKLNERVIRTKKILEDNGFSVRLGNLWNKSIGYTTGTPKERADEFNSLIENSEILMAMIGGYNSSSILSMINYELIKKNKTKIIGYSDTTAILLAVYNKTKLPVYYGPSFLTSFDENEYIKKWNLSSLKEIIKDKNRIIKNPKLWTDNKENWFLNIKGENSKKKMFKNKLISYNDGIVIGRLIGGNLNTIISIYSTEYMPKIKKGDILFIEDSNKTIDECERNFAFLKNSGILEKISGLIVGKCEGLDKKNSNETYNSLLLKFINKKIPILMNFDCSHCQPMNILKIGSKIKLDTKKKSVSIL